MSSRWMDKVAPRAVVTVEVAGKDVEFLRALAMERNETMAAYVAEVVEGHIAEKRLERGNLGTGRIVKFACPNCKTPLQMRLSPQVDGWRCPACFEPLDPESHVPAPVPVPQPERRMYERECAGCHVTFETACPKRTGRFCSRECRAAHRLIGEERWKPESEQSSADANTPS